MKHENSTTISIYVHNIVALSYDKETKTVSELEFPFYGEKLPSDEILKADIKEYYGVSVIDIISKELDNELSGTYKLTHRAFALNGEKVGEVRGHANKKSDK